MADFFDTYDNSKKIYSSEYSKFLNNIGLGLCNLVNQLDIKYDKVDKNLTLNFVNEFFSFSSPKFKFYLFIYFFMFYLINNKDKNVKDLEKDIVNFIDVSKLYGFTLEKDDIVNILSFWIDLKKYGINNIFSNEFLYKDYLLNIFFSYTDTIVFKYIYYYFLIFQYYYESYDNIFNILNNLDTNSDNYDKIASALNYKLFRYFINYLINYENINIDFNILSDWFSNIFLYIISSINNNFNYSESKFIHSRSIKNFTLPVNLILNRFYKTYIKTLNIDINKSINLNIKDFDNCIDNQLYINNLYNIVMHVTNNKIKIDNNLNSISNDILKNIEKNKETFNIYLDSIDFENLFIK